MEKVTITKTKTRKERKEKAHLKIARMFDKWLENN